jgi:hypothetical protein
LSNIKYSAVLTLFLGVALVQVQAGTIKGKVYSDGSVSLSSVTIEIQNEFGEGYVTKTDRLGQYELPNLPEGWYLIKARAPKGSIIVDPPCGFHFDFLDEFQTIERNFGFRGTGVVVDFGTPSGGNDLIFNGNDNIEFTVQISGLDINYDPGPWRIVIEGHWFIPGYGKVYPQIIGSTPIAPANVAQGSVFSDGSHRLDIRATNYPYLQDGWLARFEIEMSLIEQLALEGSGSNLAFCFESVVIYDSEKYPVFVERGNWVGMVQ